MIPRQLSFALVGLFVATTEVSAQDGRRVFEVGAVVLSASEQGAYEGRSYDQKAHYLGVRGGLRGGPLFLRGQYLEADLPAGIGMPARHAQLAEAGTGLFFAPEFRLDGSVFIRDYESPLGHQRWTGIKVGAGIHGTLWPGLAEVRAVGHYIPVVRSSVEEDKAVLGWDGEVEVALRYYRIPVRLGLGYRVERLDSAKPSDGRIVRKQRISGVLVTFELSL